MGLSIRPDCFSSSYSYFHQWRFEVAKAAGFPPLNLMQGYTKKEGENYPPVSWDLFKPNPLIELLTHSDCEGLISWENATNLANALEEILPKIEKSEYVNHFYSTTEKFIKGLRYAAENKQDLEFC